MENKNDTLSFDFAKKALQHLEQSGVSTPTLKEARENLADIVTQGMYTETRSLNDNLKTALSQKAQNVLALLGNTSSDNQDKTLQQITDTLQSFQKNDDYSIA